WIKASKEFILVYSILNQLLFKQIQKFYNKIALKRAPIILVGNKSNRAAKRKVSTKEGKVLARTLRYRFVEAFTKSNLNVEKAFYNVIY
ncbi:hypothetical protein K432DRAFT_313040, partial [Lepidopterella palustris CBS 459.81]